MGQGSVTYGEPPGNADDITSAANGLSISQLVAHQVILGQSVGEAGNPAKLLMATEIPFNGFNLSVSGTGRLMIGTTVPDANPVALQVNNGVSMFNWFMPLSNLAGTQGVGFVSGNQFFHTYEPVPVIPGQPTSCFFGAGGAGNRTGSNTGSIVNVGIGFDCMPVITTAENNVGVGIQALFSLTSGFNNLAIASGSLEALTDGTGNVVVGTNGFQNAVHAVGTTAIGDFVAGNSDSHSSTFLGAFMGSNEVQNNMLYIGADGLGIGVLPWIYANMNAGTFAGRWNGKMGVGFRTALPGLPTAQVDIVASSGAAGGGPLKLHPGPLLAVPESGLFEVDPVSGILYFTVAGVRKTVTLV
jgi:hypothetical protein